ncbi:hypothetical protein F4678DRAFT_419465 [Xylaria arbuscula]|nr:hypothetical protein F4678DRAFT_419465 [Xylaria arbuscula]
MGNLLSVTREPNPEMFNRDIKIFSTENQYLFAVALLDTQCCLGNWISDRLVKRLGMESSISPEFDHPVLRDASGQLVTACGVVDLQWKWYPYGTRTHASQFYVLPTGHVDVVIGVEFILSNRLVLTNEGAFLTLVRDKKSKKGDDAAIKQAKKRQQEEKAALEEQKKQQKQGEFKQGGSQQ